MGDTCITKRGMKGQKKYKYEISAPSGKKVFRLFVPVVLSNLQIATTMDNVNTEIVK